MINNIKRRILVAPLDWGLGHTTRCIPIIRYLLQLGHSVIVAGNEQQRSFVAKTIAGVEFVHLDGYDITYAANDGLGKIKLLSQVPGISKSIEREHRWLLEQIDDLSIDGIISDNRYGLYHPKVPSVILTHQLAVQTGLGKRADRVIQKMHYKYLERFNAVWVPDVQGEGNLAGALSQTDNLPAHTSYIGHLSQFEGMKAEHTQEEHILVLMSGPEPQRTILADILWKQLAGYNGKVVFVAGKDGAKPPTDMANNITFYDRIAGEELGLLIMGAKFVICRSGYSTIMDLILLHKKAILIPTPGQTEQEYLGKYLNDKGIFYSVPQKDLDLDRALSGIKNYNKGAQITEAEYSGYKNVLDNWLLKL